MYLKLIYGRKELLTQFPGDGPVRVGEVLQSVQEDYPEIYQLWCDNEGYLRRSLLVFINGEHVRYRKGLDTELRDGDEVYVIPMIAGG
jgi:molybdopterin converting factor small subunit